ncbi:MULTISPECIES: alpha/beta fold hydrolase [Nocardia]|uniref:Alpha/beta hydrolase n=1 Tax=Nocardia implantans TaxID=3108168 RepID=A0ABU6B3J5_9NOCA|nr:MULTISPECIES: alpha/beta hydrolase [unclassified Nocardia]MBF6195992.1 alpha/beta hydrolase [Nocardia beijingensis]MEA3532273.1 alpha/beta hydrolase [Nocardia sp. CDC192]MEB3514332.1 alpha/beta hydrolase [Nocardia sp. CDC186]
MVEIGRGRIRRRTTRATTAIAAAIAAGGLAVACTASRTTHAGPTEDAPKPTIVLEHGAFADGSSWNDVIEKLRADHYPVVAAANPLRGPAADATTLRALVDHIGGPVILVGHSYGGSVISAAAAGKDEVKALVFVAAFLPAPGETALELTGKYPGSTLRGTLNPVPFTGIDGGAGTDLYIQQDEFPQQFAADVSADRAALMAAAQRPIAQSALEEKATVAAWTEKPSWDVITTEDRNIPVAAQRFMAERAHASITEVAASHSVAVSHPDVVADVIEQAARATR